MTKDTNFLNQSKSSWLYVLFNWDFSEKIYFGQETGIFCSIFNGFYAFHPKLYYKSLIIGLESWDIYYL